MLSKKTILLFLLCLSGAFSIAQRAHKVTAENKYRAVHWTIYDGVSQGENYYMLKDGSGFLWIGSMNGLNRFDGNLIKKYYHDPHDEHSIVGSFINGLIEDSLHNVWIGTNTGLSRYDVKADTFSNFLTGKKTDPDHSITPFWATKDKLYALESSSRIVVYNTHSFAKRQLVNLTAADSVNNSGPSIA